MVQEGRYVMTHHALDEMIADDLHIQDIEHIILNGRIIRVEREKENMEQKYVIYGETRNNFAAEVVVKVKGQVVIITVHLL
jgi:hypothetical protein